MIRLFFLIILFFNFALAQKVIPGIEVLKKNNFDVLKGKRVGIIVNHTSIDFEGKNLADILIDAKINLVAIFSPEHGFFGDVDAGKEIGDSFYRGVKIYSLYGKTKRPTPDMLEGLDVVVFDIQDVGARFYTYLTTMGYAMEECARKGIKFVVLDRPNPVSSSIIEGPILDDDIKAFTAYFNLPVRHSLTAGEVALFHKVKNSLHLELEVIKMENYKRDMFFDDTGIKWINPSPNIRNLNSAILYSGIGCFEATNISVGRGTDRPFEFFGSPWMDNVKISDELNQRKLKGVKFYPCNRIPNTDIYQGEVIKGVCIDVSNKRKVRSFRLFVNAIYLIKKYHPDKIEIRSDEISKMTGSKDFLRLLDEGKEPDYIIFHLEKKLKSFKRYLKKQRIYLY